MPGFDLDWANVASLNAPQGAPGCWGYIDVVHIDWLNCPAHERAQSTGKAGMPTVAFNCCAIPGRCIVHVGEPQAGARNDKTISRLDE